MNNCTIIGIPKEITLPIEYYISLIHFSSENEYLEIVLSLILIRLMNDQELVLNDDFESMEILEEYMKIYNYGMIWKIQSLIVKM